MDGWTQLLVTIFTCIVAAVSSTVVALINSNARQARSEQKFTDLFDAMQNNLNSLNRRMNELSETDSCCKILKGDVADIKETVNLLAQEVVNLKESSEEFDAKSQEAFKAIAADRISQAHRYFKQKGEITESSKKSMHLIYESYKSFGGNGYIEAEMKYLDSLPEV